MYDMMFFQFTLIFEKLYEVERSQNLSILHSRFAVNVPRVSVAKFPGAIEIVKPSSCHGALLRLSLP